jgi:broad specificity phosphatase PhoE
MAGPFPKLLILMRHVQKTGQPGDTGLSAFGNERARRLAEAWSRVMPSLDMIIACRSTTKSSRPVDTVRPLADTLNLSIDDRWGTQDYQALARHLISDPGNRHRRILICWRHDTLPQLATCFGAAAPSWPDDLYDRLWLLEQVHEAVLLRVEDQPPRMAYRGPGVSTGEDA